MARTIRGKLVGQSFYKSAKAIEGVMEAGASVLLIREFQNPYDPNAVEVYVKLGHVNRETAAVLADLFDHGHHALTRVDVWGMPATLGQIAEHIIEVTIPDPPSAVKPAIPSSPRTMSDDDDEIPF